MRQTSKILYLVLALFGITILGQAQSSRALPFLDIQADPYSAGMGGLRMAEARGGMYIYSNPTSLFTQETNFSIGYGGTLYNEKVGNNLRHLQSVAGSWRFHRNHALLVGYRFYKGIDTFREDEYGQRKLLKPFDYSVDALYAFRVGDHFSAYLGGSFIQSYIGRIAYTGGGHAGIVYRGNGQLFQRTAPYLLALTADNIGGMVKYGKHGVESTMPGSATLTGVLEMAPTAYGTLELGAAIKYHFMPAETQAVTGHLGLRYHGDKNYSISAGTIISKEQWIGTLGWNANFKHFGVNVAYSFANRVVYNRLTAGITINM